jgi:hypothetical protein
MHMTCGLAWCFLTTRPPQFSWWVAPDPPRRRRPALHSPAMARPRWPTTAPVDIATAQSLCAIFELRVAGNAAGVAAAVACGGVVGAPAAAVAGATVGGAALGAGSLAFPAVAAGGAEACGDYPEVAMSVVVGVQAATKPPKPDNNASRSAWWRLSFSIMINLPEYQCGARQHPQQSALSQSICIPRVDGSSSG